MEQTLKYSAFANPIEWDMDSTIIWKGYMDGLIH